MNKSLETYFFKDLLKKEDKKLQPAIKDFYIKKNSLTKAYFLQNVDTLKLTTKQFKYYKEIGEKVLAGKDVTFDIGHRFFYNVEIDINKKVFIPQPDSELLVEKVLADYKKGEGLEIGSGTGAICIAIAKNSKIIFDAIDINLNAIKISKRNAFNNETGKRIHFIRKSFVSLPIKEYDFIVSNPPYIKKGDASVSNWVKEHQPKKALYSKKNGLAFIESILEKGNNFLKPQGKIYLEFGFEQKSAVELLVKKYYKKYTFYKDLNDNWRVVVIEIDKQEKNN